MTSGECCQPCPTPTPTSTHQPSRLVRILQRLVRTSPSPPQPSQLSFSNSPSAAAANYQLLQQHDFDLASVLTYEQNSVTSPGYEFRCQELLKPLLAFSSDSDKLNDLCFNGVDYPFRNDADLSDDTRLQDASARLQKGNNKSALGKENFISTALQKEIDKGWQFPLP